MPMLGQNVLPESVNQRRRAARQRLQELRDPLKRKREETIPGPDVVGVLENNVMDLRDKVATREGLVARLKQRQEDSSNSSSSNDKSGSNDSHV